MDAFRYVDGKLVSFDDPGHPVYLLPPTYPLPDFRHIFRSRNERRRDARWGTRGRRGARPVQRLREAQPIPDPVCLRRHVFGDRERRVLLYLPEGEQPTEAHGRDLDAALR